MSSKMGRPTDNPLNHDIKVRVDDAMYQKLLKYCAEHDTKKAEVIRMALGSFFESAK